MHKDLKQFLETGRIIPGSNGYEDAFTAMQRTALGQKHRLNPTLTSGKLFVSTQFTRTVNLPKGRSFDHLQRDVHWVLLSLVGTAVIIIPEQAEYALKILHELSPVHLVTYNAPVTRKMLHFNDLKYFAHPSLPDDWVAPLWLKVRT